VLTLNIHVTHNCLWIFNGKEGELEATLLSMVVHTLQFHLDFSLWQCVQTSSGSHPASCSVGIGDSFHGGKVARAWSCI